MPVLSANSENIFTTIKINAGVYDRKWLRFVIKWSILSTLILFSTAFFSLSYYYYDEHWQTIEFAGLKMGKTTPEKMPWEYPAKMRSWLQPAIYVCIAKAAGAAGITDPFTLSMFFRFFSAFWGALMCASMMFCAHLLFHEERQRKAAVRIICLLGFLPYMLVRTSSESLSSSFSMAGFALLMLGSTGSNIEQRQYPGMILFVTGVLWGLAFEFRYQCAFLVAGFIFWMVFVSIKNRKIAARSAAVLFSGILLSVLLCTFIDMWGYGEFVFVPWNYLYQNIFLDKAAEWGTLPFWGYILLIIKINPSVLLIIILAAGTVCAWIRYPRHPLVWGTFLFFIAHCFVARKDLRFLMNMAVPSIMLLIYAFSPNDNKEGPADRVFEKIWNCLHKAKILPLFYAFNICLLLFYPILRNRADLTFDKYLYRNTTPPFHAFSLGLHPYAPFGGGIQYDWYKPENITITAKESLSDILAETGGAEFNLVVYGDNDEIDAMKSQGHVQFTVCYSESFIRFSTKSLIRYLLGKESKERKIWTLYRVKAPALAPDP
jgi:phosphatidylinositol glycan class B